MLDIRKLDFRDINIIVELSGKNSKLVDDVLKERKVIVSGKSFDELIKYFGIPYEPKDKSLTMYQTRIWYK